MTEENGEVIVDENDDDVTPESNEEEDDNEKDELIAAAESKAEKATKNFKKLAKELNDLKKSSKGEVVDISEQVSKQVQEEMYYANNPTAKEFKTEIKEIQENTGLSPEDALTLYIAKNKPELIGKQSSL